MTAQILLVDDDNLQRLLYMRELSAAGYSVETASDAHEALQKFTANPPDLVVLDIRMPGRDGTDVMARMLGVNRRVPIILHTAYSFDRENYLCWAANACLTKSSDLSELKETIGILLSRRFDIALGTLTSGDIRDSRQHETSENEPMPHWHEEIMSSPEGP